MEASVFVQYGKKLNPKKAAETITQKDAKLAIIYTCLKDDNKSKEFFNYLIKNLPTPFIGVKVSGLITPKEGYTEDSIGITTLSGDFETKIITEEIDLQNPVNTANKLIQELEPEGTCLTYTATYLWQLSTIDAILRRIQTKNPNLKIFGGGSAPNPIISTNKGTYENHIACAYIKKLNCELDIYSGFKFDPDRNETITITKSDELKIYEINGKNAGDEYSRVQRMRPYFFNMLAKMLVRPDLPKVCKVLAKTSPSLYEGILKFSVDLFGYEIEKGLVEPMTVYKINETDDSLAVGSYRPKGSTLRRVAVTKENQIALYDEITEKYGKTNLTILNSCAFNAFWMDFNFKAVEEKLKKMKNPYMIGFFFGEYKTPNKKGQTDTTRNCIVDIMGIE